MTSERLKQLAVEFSQLIGDFEAGPGMSEWLSSAYAHHANWAACVREGRTPEQGEHFVRAGFAMYVLHAAAELPEGDRVRNEALQCLRAGAFSQFEDLLFEAEVAVYFRDSLSAVDISFGPAKGNPDVIAGLRVPGRVVSTAVECKRISPRVKEHADLDLLAVELEHALRDQLNAKPCKVIVWLHVRAGRTDAGALLGVITRLIAESDSTRWCTAADDKGAFQVSVCALGTLGEFNRAPVSIDDVPAEPGLRVASEVERTEDGDLVRIKYVLSLRSDIVRDHIGSLVTRVQDAAEQLSHSLEAGKATAIAVRIRPPKDRGSIAEADALVRRILKTPPGTNAAVAMLFWDESERIEGSKNWPDTDRWNREVRLGHRLACHFVSGEPRAIDFSTFDSGGALMPATPSVLMRDPSSGRLVPIATDVFTEIVTGSDAPRFATVISAAELAEADNTLWGYLRPTPEFWQSRADAIIGVILVEGRQFRVLLLSDDRLQCVEIVGGQTASVATIDTHAWQDATEIMYILHVATVGFTLGLLHREFGRVWAESVGLRKLPDESSVTDFFSPGAVSSDE